MDKLKMRMEIRLWVELCSREEEQVCVGGREEKVCKEEKIFKSTQKRYRPYVLSTLTILPCFLQKVLSTLTILPCFLQKVRSTLTSLRCLLQKVLSQHQVL